LLPKWSRTQQIKAYKDGVLHDWASPNSTDVHSIKLISNIKSYFYKYMTKSGQSSDIHGRLWGCSYELTHITGAVASIYNRIDDDLSRVRRDKTIKVVTSDYFTIIFITILQLTHLGCTELLLIWEEFLILRFSEYRPPTLFV
jgi:hypothetical protein